MLRIKKQLPLSASIDDTEYKKNQEDIKNSIKQLYIGNQNKKKTINEYAQLTTQIREEYAKLQAKCAQLENTLQKYKDYVENRWTPPAPPGVQRKRIFKKPKIPYYHQYDGIDKGYETEEDNGEYYDYESKPKPKRKKRIVYADEIDGDNENDDDNEVIEQDEDEDKEEYVRVIKKRKKPVGKKQPNKDINKKVGITKST